MIEIRKCYLDALRKDICGPYGGETEQITLGAPATPSDLYVTGILYAPLPELSLEEDADREGPEDETGSPGDSVSMGATYKPSSMGLSFTVRSLDGSDPTIRMIFNGGMYGVVEPAPEDEGNGRVWSRRPVHFEDSFCVSETAPPTTSPEAVALGLGWYVRATRTSGADSSWQVTVAITNGSKLSEYDRDQLASRSIFQSRIEIRPGTGCVLAARPSHSSSTGSDEESEISRLIYRETREWAVGHTCSATWKEEDGSASCVSTTWLPSQIVPSMNADGDPIFRKFAERVAGDAELPYSAKHLGTASTSDELIKLLDCVPDAYLEWQAEVARSVEKDAGLDPELRNTVGRNLAEAERLAGRMKQGVALLAIQPVFEAFQLAQQAMALQRAWAWPGQTDLRWRPFQLAFQLLTIAGLVNDEESDAAFHPDRKLMDLLWFPTGGGKTEAYLAITAFTLIYRRLSREQPDDGAGVGVLMRYTLRLLTIQQFERASRLVLACEVLRRRRATSGDDRLGEKPFSIGLWVGGDATPNRLSDLETPNLRDRAKQLARCPCCGGGTLEWTVIGDYEDFEARCKAEGCELASAVGALPLYTIDELVYRSRPSLIIGTIDKFAQVARNKRTAGFFGEGAVQPPDLIIQDELHLITGPLGTIAGLYETAIDAACTRPDGTPPKVIGSTATIRRAADQVRALFDRNVAQFPPPVLDASNSCFAVECKVTDQTPGRLYLGMTTAGLSPKFALQAACGSLSQNASDTDGVFADDASRDPYWTLLIYFNALRELGGALVMMNDDVPATINAYAKLHGVAPRANREQLELSSRLGSQDIPQHIADLEKPYPEQNLSEVLATNMISVGVDIPRLGLMVVNGQPKGMSEYIQATSRVGRGNVPGLILTVYNAGRPRDRSHFESFRTWHQSLYSSVEATSVTPFSPRARDKALHAAIVALARHVATWPGAPGELPLLESPELSDQPGEPPGTRRAAVERLVDRLLDRVERIDPRERDGTRRDAMDFLDHWMTQAPSEYWNEKNIPKSLMVSAERVAMEKAVHGTFNYTARATPNSMREVEPETKLRLIHHLSARGDQSDA